MRNSKHGLKALVLAMMAAALGMMAFAGGAQAKVGFLHGKSHEHELFLNPNPLSSTTTNTPGTFLVNLGVPASDPVDGEGGLGSLLVPTRDLKLECHVTHVEEGKITSSTEGLGKVTFLTCLTLSLSGGEALPCTLTTGGSITAKTIVLPILHNSEPFVLFEPHKNAKGEEEPFTTVSYKAGTECPLPLNNVVRGAVSALVHNLDAVNQQILFAPAIQLLTGDRLTFGGNAAYIDAEATLFLLPPHEGQKLGIH